MPDAPVSVTDGSATPPAEVPATPDLSPDELGDKGEKALDAWKQRAKVAEAKAKEARGLEARLKEIEDRDKSETQKLADRATAAEKAAADASQKYLRLKVGASKGLAPELSERLQGTSEDEMAADADALLAVLKPNENRPGSFDAGARPTSAPAGADMNALLRQAAGRG